MPNYSDREKHQVLGAFRLGNSVKNIAEVLNLPIRSIYRWCRRFQEKGHCDRTQGSGRPRRTSRRADLRLRRIVQRARFLSSSQLLAKWHESVSSSTVKRRLHELGFAARRPAVFPSLTLRHRTVRLRWAMARCHFRAQWHKNIFSDESRIKLHPIDGRVRVWRRPSERFSENCHVPSVEYGGGSIHVWWGGISKGAFPNQLGHLDESSQRAVLHGGSAESLDPFRCGEVWRTRPVSFSRWQCPGSQSHRRQIFQGASWDTVHSVACEEPWSQSHRTSLGHPQEKGQATFAPANVSPTTFRCCRWGVEFDSTSGNRQPHWFHDVSCQSSHTSWRRHHKVLRLLYIKNSRTTHQLYSEPSTQCSW